MRLSEKTLELNFCAQVERRAGRPCLWFGLTQRQEARAGFDAAMRSGGRLFLFQIKASNHLLKGGWRQFRAQHRQMTALQQRVRAARRSVFYVLPLLGATAEIPPSRDWLDKTWLLDVADLPDPMPAPTVRQTSRRRKSGIHYIRAAPYVAMIHSEPSEVRLESAAELAATAFERSPGINELLLNEESERELEFERLRRLFTRSAVGLVL